MVSTVAATTRVGPGYSGVGDEDAPGGWGGRGRGASWGGRGGERGKIAAGQGAARPGSPLTPAARGREWRTRPLVLSRDRLAVAGRGLGPSVWPDVSLLLLRGLLGTPTPVQNEK
ncbi:hypothetical protein U0070_008039 [Myodes glareolus]|uniref:Uncharacterized protein n=1 Tax=Myodes glareolus TaxID=447135 RepID=A0AAW0HAW5_MYOGA